MATPTKFVLEENDILIALKLGWQRIVSAFCRRSQQAPSECPKSQSAWIRRPYVSRHLCNLAEVSFTRDRDILDNAGSIPRRFRRNPIERTSRGLETINHDGHCLFKKFIQTLRQRKRLPYCRWHFKCIVSIKIVVFWLKFPWSFHWSLTASRREATNHDEITDAYMRHPWILLLTLTLIPAWISNYIRYKVWVKSLIHSQTSRVQPLKFGND